MCFPRGTKPYYSQEHLITANLLGCIDLIGQ